MGGDRGAPIQPTEVAWSVSFLGGRRSPLGKEGDAKWANGFTPPLFDRGAASITGARTLAGVPLRRSSFFACVARQRPRCPSRRRRRAYCLCFRTTNFPPHIPWCVFFFAFCPATGHSRPA